MRNTSRWLGCLALIVLVGCAASAPTATSTEATSTTAAPPAPGCSGGTCTVVLMEANGACSVVPDKLPVNVGDAVLFAAEVSPQSAAVVITPKPGNPVGVTFRNGPPGRIPRGEAYDAGGVSGSPGGRYTYKVTFVNQANPPGIVCTVDPVICIKGGLDPGQDECN